MMSDFKHCYKHINRLLPLLLISSLFVSPLSAAVINATHWVIEPGDSLYKIARNVFPNSASQQAQLRKALVELNPQAFKNGASNISVGDTLNLPDFAIQQKSSPPPAAATKKPATVIIPKKVLPKSTPQPQAKPTQVATADPQDIVGQVIINVGKLTAQNRGAIRALTRRSSIYRGDTIATSGRSLTQIRLKDGALLSLRPHTEIKIAEYRYNGQEDGSEQSILELLKGGFRTITGAIGHRNKQNYQIRTSMATIGIRGTHYSLVLCENSSCSAGDAGNVEDGLYGGVTDGSIILENETGQHRFNNDRYFKLTSAMAIPTEFLFPPAILKRDPAILAAASKAALAANNDLKKTRQSKQAPRRLAVIFEANQPDSIRPPKTTINDTNRPPFQPDKAPSGAGMAIAFNERDVSGANVGTAAPVVISADKDNVIFLGANRTPIAGRETSSDPQTGELVRYELVVVSADGALAELVPSSVGANPTLGVNWGRWNGDFTVLENGDRLDTSQNLHYMYSENLTSPEQLANLGGLGASVAYNIVDGTLPTDNQGNVAINLASINMNVDFIKQQISQYDVSATVNNVNYNASASNIAFQNLDRSFSIQSISAGCVAQCAGEANILFVGDQAQGAITSYSIGELDGSAGAITGTGLLTSGGQ